MKRIVLSIAFGCALMSCGSNATKQAEAEQTTRTEDSLKAEIAKKNVIDSMNAVNAQANQEVNKERTTTGEGHHSSEHHEQRSGNSSNGGSSNVTTGVNNSSAPQSVPIAAQPAQVAAPASAPAPAVTAAPATEEKKGWSAKAKGALIGAGAGAAAGALLDSKKKGQAVKGGIMGGIIGGAAGLGAGALIDHKKKQNDSTGK